MKERCPIKLAIPYFKILKGKDANLANITPVEGTVYITSDTHKMYIDMADGSSGRICLNAITADELSCGDIGASNKPVYFEDGFPIEGSIYAGGTKVTLNGSGKGGSTASFYAPTAKGTTGQLLVSTAGTPAWSSVAYVTSTTSSGQTTPGTISALNIYGQTYGNITSNLLTVGKMSYGDPGPQIRFSVSASSSQSAALIFTDHDSIGAGVSLSLVSNQDNTWFIAPTIKALTKFIGELQGNATTATKLATARTISLTGDASGSISFDGSANKSITVTIADDSHNHIISNIDGLQSTLDSKMSANPTSIELNTTGSLKSYGGFIDFHYHDSSGNPTDVSGTAVDKTPDYTSRIIESSAGTITINGASFKGGIITGSLNGNANTATKLEKAIQINDTTFDGSTTITTTKWGTARNIYIADATAAHIGTAVSVNGSANVTLKLPSTITAELIGAADYIRYQDTRDEDVTPGDSLAGLSIHLKYNTADGLSDGGTYHPIVTMKDWRDYSGGPYGQIAVTANQNFWFRVSTSDTAWGSWKKILDTSNYSSTLDSRYVNVSGDTMTGSLVMNNNAITGVNSLAFADPGVNEGITWTGGNGWNIYESPDDLTNDAGNLQFVHGSTRRLTINTGGYVDINSRLVVRGNGSSYNEGIRILPAGNGWSNIFFSADASLSGAHDGGWLIGRRGAAGGTCGAIGDFTIEENDSSGVNLTIHKDQGGATLYGRMRVNGEVQAVSANAFRMVYGNYGVFWRNDGSNTYLLITNSDDQYGNWNDLRPFYCNNSTGRVQMANGASVGGYSNTNYSLSTQSFICNSWVRTIGSTGWYNETYDGGWYMTDSTYVRSYSSKPVLIGNNLYIGTSSGAGVGIALYNTSAPNTYGIHMSYTSSYGTHGDVTGDWANYFCFDGATTRGWIFKHAGTNVASINGSGNMTLNGQLKRVGKSSSWINGRDNALVRTTTCSGYSPAMSVKTPSGSWEIGAYNNTNFAERLIFSYASDANYSAGTNNTVTTVNIANNGRLYGAAWNDYAEFRACQEEFKPGQVVYENGDDTLSISYDRLQRGCSIVSDTYGFAINEGENTQCPIAVSGRVLAYPYESIEEFKKHIGWPVCSGPDGTVSIMTEEEEAKYSSRIIGTISAIPDYETWGQDSVLVDGRVWIKVK